MDIIDARISEAEAAHKWRLLQAERLLQSAGFYEHSDGQWYDHPEQADEE